MSTSDLKAAAVATDNFAALDFSASNNKQELLADAQLHGAYHKVWSICFYILFQRLEIIELVETCSIFFPFDLVCRPPRAFRDKLMYT